jgi:hypothetical protein
MIGTEPSSSPNNQVATGSGWRSALTKVGALSGLTVAAVLVHGYHPMVEDAEIYIPAIRRLLNQGLYPHDSAFFAGQTRWSLFPQIIAFSIRTSHIPFDWAILCWHGLSIFLLLAACWRISELCFPHRRAQWFGVALAASLLTMPVAGTALYIMDQYLTARSLSTAAAVWAVASFLGRKWKIGLFWIGFTFLVHPLMAAFVGAYLTIWYLLSKPAPMQLGNRAAALMILVMPVTEAYRQAVATRSYLFLSHWEWYEWLGAIAPLAILWWFSRIARRGGAVLMEAAARSLAVFGLLFLCAGLVVSFVPSLFGLAELQPMRSLHLIYILMLLLGGGLIEQLVLPGRSWLGLALLLAISAGMFHAQRLEFPSTAHIEAPWTTSTNEWVQGFLWIRDHTPADAYFALNPRLMALPGEDEHGFRALAERSRLSDSVKDPGAVTIAPSLAQLWRSQVRAQDGWKDFQLSDFSRLRQQFGVNWVVLEQPGRAGLDCPFQNNALQVCRIPDGD